MAVACPRCLSNHWFTSVLAIVWTVTLVSRSRNNPIPISSTAPPSPMLRRVSYRTHSASASATKPSPRIGEVHANA